MRSVNGHRDLIEALKRATIFTRLSVAQLTAVARHSRTIELTAGEVLFQHGGKANALFLLVRGQLKLYRISPAGQEIIIEVLEPGATFGQTRGFLKNPRFHLSGAALVDSEVIADPPAAQRSRQRGGSRL